MWGGQTFCSPMFRCQSFSKPMPLDCELQKCLSVPPFHMGPITKVDWSCVFLFSFMEAWRRLLLVIFFSPCRRLEPAGVGYFPSPGRLGSNKTPADEAVVN